MCGIAAYYNIEGISVPELRKALAGLDAIRHRGPDGEGAVLINMESGEARTLHLPESPADLSYDLNPADYGDKSAHLILMHRRLSIFDLSSKGHQPMKDEGGNWILLNGEVYNFLEIREELKAKGYAFQSGTDTEVILAAYREWGAECLKRFNGMWAIILYDAEKKKLFVSNDRMGIKALYRFHDGKRAAYASEVKSFLHFGVGVETLDQDNIRAFIDYGLIDHDNSTFFKEIERVGPAHYHFLDPRSGSKTAETAFWNSPPLAELQISEKEALDRFSELFEQSLRYRLRTDVPWGITLSGGIDSSAIVYAVDRMLKARGDQEKIRSFSAVFPGKFGDESPFVNAIVKDLGLDARFTNPLESFDFDDFERFVFHQDFPVNSTSSYSKWVVFKLVAESEVKVILNGQGGDEILGGYHHHLHRYIGELIRKGRWALSVKEAQAVGAIQGKPVWPMYRMIVSKEIIGRSVPEHAKGKTLRDRLEKDLRSLMMPFMLRYEDRISMAFGIESRVPFLDHELVEFTLRVPSRYKIRDGWQKSLLRKSMKGVPRDIAYRKDKKGFSTPQKDWVNAHRDRFLAYLDYLDQADIGYNRSALLAEQDYSMKNSYQFRHLSVGAWLKTFQAPGK